MANFKALAVAVCGLFVLTLTAVSASAHPGHVDLQPQWSWNWGHKDMDKEASKKVQFKLYTRENSDDDNPEWVTAVDITGKLPVDLVYFEGSRPTKIIIHGWQSKLKHAFAIKDAFLAQADVNVVIVDWKRMDSLLYPSVVQRLQPIARQVAKYMDYLVAHEHASPDAFHLIGHSLGSHISGLASSYMTGGIVGRITGLDPAGPLIQDMPDHRLDVSQATFVDVIHTCGNILGYPHAIGHVDFFPNDGVCAQPGCSVEDSLLAGKCSHNRAWYLFRETILDGEAMMALPAQVPSRVTTTPCHAVNMTGTEVAMGAATPSSTRGQYCLSTNSEEPYGYGHDVVINKANPLSSHQADAMKRRLLRTSHD